MAQFLEREDAMFFGPLPSGKLSFLRDPVRSLMRCLNLYQLQTLVAIADLGTFAAAEQALHLAPPTVSLHVLRSLREFAPS